MRALLLLLILPLGAPKRPADELRDILQALRGAVGVDERIELAGRLAGLNDSRAAGHLARLVRQDPDASVRVAAARGLGRTRTDNDLDLLVELIQEGGPREVRATLAKSLNRKDDGVEELRKAFDGSRADALGKGLILRALGFFRDQTTGEVLQLHARGTDAGLRWQALRALRDRPKAGAALRSCLREALEKSRDRETLLQALDLLEDLEDESFLPLVVRLETFLEPVVRRAAGHLVAKLRYLEAIRLAGEGTPDGYGNRKIPPEPPTRARFDLVFVIDVTGSTVVVLDDLKDRIRREMKIIERLGTSLRIGIVGYRMWKNLARHVRREEILPLTYDFERIETFLAELKSRGPDSQGAAVERGLWHGLARMGWRWNASRFVHLVADSKCHDAKAARLVVRVHFQADRTRTRVAYVLRTRRSIPDVMKEIARVGGTGLVEVVE
jgi:HEAT repeats